MVEFFKSIFDWFVSNKNEILLFFTSTNFIAFVSTIVLIIKQIKSSKENNKNVVKLTADLGTSNELANNVRHVSESSAVILDNSEVLKTRIDDVERKVDESLELLKQKLDAVLEVQSIVYSSIKDDVVRKNVSNVLITAKLAENTTKAELEKEIEALKLVISNKMNDVKTAVEETSSKVKRTVSVKNKKQAVPRC